MEAGAADRGGAGCTDPGRTAKQRGPAANDSLPGVLGGSASPDSALATAATAAQPSSCV